MADTGAVELNEAFAGCELRRLLDWVVVDDRQRRVGLFDDRCLLGLGDGELGGHCRVESEGCDGDVARILGALYTLPNGQNPRTEEGTSLCRAGVALDAGRVGGRRTRFVPASSASTSLGPESCMVRTRTIRTSPVSVAGLDPDGLDRPIRVLSRLTFGVCHAMHTGQS